MLAVTTRSYKNKGLNIADPEAPSIPTQYGVACIIIEWY